MSKNLFYSLPEVLQSEIYQYDNTYRIFGTKAFKKEIFNSYISFPHIVDKCRKMIINYLDDTIYDGGCVWNNEYGRIDPDDDLNSKLVKYTSIDDFFVVMSLNMEKTALYFKILPKGSTSLNCAFLRNKNPSNWDGYFFDIERNSTIMSEEEITPILKDLNMACIYKSTEMINGWGAVNWEDPPIWTYPRIEMYLSH
jgi:hypothetical protein